MPAIVHLLCLLGCLQQLQGLSAASSELATTPRRAPRLMQFLREPQPKFNANRRAGPGQMPRVRPNGDNLHPPLPWRAPLPPPVQAGQQLMRREFNGNWPYNGGTRIAHTKDAAPVLDVGKNQFYRPKESAQHNFNGNQYTPNFKASPHFNVNSAVKQEPNKFSGYSPVKQYAIPVEANKYVPAYAEATPNQHSPAAPAVNGYAVYEESEQGVKNGAPFSGHPQVPSKLSKEAESYLHFMSTNEYFLPKREPNYKQQDMERDQISYQQQRLVQQQQQQVQQQQVLQQHQLQHQQHIPYQPQVQQHHQHQQQLHRQQQLLDSSGSSSFNKPLQVADLFYQQDPAPPNSAVVRGSYQAGQNAFVVKSDGNKSVKHILSTSQMPRTTQKPAQASTAVSYTWVSAHKTETPEPLRFEFTEHDAIRGSASYTNAPQGQKYFYETHTPAPHTPPASVAPAIASPPPVKEHVADAKESGEYVNKHATDHVSAPAPAPTVETPKDNEAYCEKICANVYDENDEIVCGSDGYMYTGETQLECYSTCLNIEVSIKSKGSCT